MMHIELIKPQERLSPSLGGTGYVGRAQAATLSDLINDADKRLNDSILTGITIWKVLRESKSPPKRLEFENGKRVRCSTVGGTGEWWFVSVECEKVLKALVVR